MNWQELKRMREERAELKQKMQNMLASAKQEQRDLTAEEAREFDRMAEKAEKLATDVERADAAYGGTGSVDGRALMLGNLSTGASNEEAYALRQDESARDHLARRGITTPAECRDLSLGGFIRAIAAGPMNDTERRALSMATGASGGFTVPEYLMGNFIDRLRAEDVLMRAGATVVPLEGKTHVARIAADPAAAWRPELETDPGTAMNFERVTFEPKTLRALVKISRELAEDSVNVNQAIEHSLARSFAVELDSVGLVGSGTGAEPRGIANTSGRHIIDHNAALANYDVILNAVGELTNANAGDPTAVITSAREALTISKFKDTTNQPLRPPVVLERVPFFSTTSIPVDEGAGDNESSLFVGDFRDLWIGIRTHFTVEVLRDKYADEYAFAVLAALRADVQLVRPASFTQVRGITP